MALTHAQFRDLFQSEHARLHRFLHRLAGNAADADDLLQETFLSAWRKRDQYAGRGSAAGWVRRIAYHLYLNARTKRVRRDDLAPPAPSVPPARDVLDGVADRETLRVVVARVQDVVATLPDGPREAFVMFRFEGLSVGEIAEMTGAPPKTVETRIRRAAHLLHEALHPWKEQLPTS
jgi:RNA polymerase sigma-70 factor (ECF subfamily)